MSAPVLYDALGRPLAPSIFSSMHQGGRWGSHERRNNVYTVAADSRETADKYTREQTAALSRHLIANMGSVRGPVFDLTRYSIGEGLVPQSQAENEKAGDEYEAYFQDWSERCDVSGKFTFWELQKIASRAVDGDGDVGAHDVISSPRADHQVQLIEGHRIENPKDSGDSAKAAGWHDGVLTNDVGRPLQYSVREGKDGWRPIAADYFTLLMDPDRCDQDRGLSALSHGIENAFDGSDILTFSKIGVKMREAIGFAIYTETGTHDSGLGLIQEGFSAADTGSFAMDTLQAGMIPRLKQNERIADIQSSRPSPVFTGYLDYLIRDLAIGLGLPFEFVWNPAALNGTSQRFVLSKAQRRFAERQTLIRKWVQREWNLVIGRAIARKELPNDKRWRKITLQRPAKITVDVGREAQQNREDMKFGVRTMAEDVGERGADGDWKDVRNQLTREVDDLLDRAEATAKKRGIALELAIDLYRQRGANPVSTPAQGEEDAGGAKNRQSE